MAIIGSVSVKCRNCGKTFELELPCSMATEYVMQAGGFGNLLCNECIVEQQRVRSKDEIRFETLWAPPSLNFLVFSNPAAELYEYLCSHPDTIYTLTPRAFEVLIADILRNFGFAVELTPETRDGGIDIIACYKDNVPGPSLYLVECKLYKPPQKVGIEPVQRLLGITYSKEATKGLLVTSSFFTSPARQIERRHQYRIALKDYEELKTWIEEINNRYGRQG